MIEVTPEMIAAGREALSSRWHEFTGTMGFQLWDEVLTEVFRAMTEARPPKLYPDAPWKPLR